MCSGTPIQRRNSYLDNNYFSDKTVSLEHLRIKNLGKIRGNLFREFETHPVRHFIHTFMTLN